MNFYLKALVFICLLAISGFTIHGLVQAAPAFSLIKLYAFLGIATLGSVCVMRYLYNLVPNQLGYVFLVTVFVKFGLALILFPQLLSEEPSLTKTQILSFLVPYFCFLGVEAFMVINWLNKKTLEDSTTH